MQAARPDEAGLKVRFRRLFERQLLALSYDRLGVTDKLNGGQLGLNSTCFQTVDNPDYVFYKIAKIKEAPVQLVGLHVHVLHASFATIFGGIENVPASLRRPASHFQRIERLGQYAALVEAIGDDGQRGWGEAFGLPDPGMAASLIETVIAPALTGTDCDDPTATGLDLKRFFFALGHTRGPAMEALSAVDIALWDLKARRLGRPLCELLGGTVGPVGSYVGSVPFLPTPEASGERALGFAAEGYGGIKLKIGRGPQVDAAHVRALRSMLGPDIAIMLDANAAYGIDEAIAVAKAVAPFDVAWLEEPIVPDDPLALACVRAQSPVKIAAGENEFDIAQFRRFVEAGALDIVQPNITRAGGVSGLLAIDALCVENGLALAPHGVGSAIGLAAALHVCRAAASFSVYEANRLINPLRDELTLEPPRRAGSAFVLGHDPGHGAVPRREALRSFAMPSPSREVSHAAE